MKNKLLIGILTILLILLVSASASAITFLTYCRDYDTKEPIACDVTIGSATEHAGGQNDKASFIVKTNTIYNVEYRNDAENYKSDIDPIFIDDGLYNCEKGKDCTKSVGNFKTVCKWHNTDKRWYCTATDIKTNSKIYFVYLGKVGDKYTAGRVNYLKQNNAPQITAIPKQTIQENETFSLLPLYQQK